MILRRARLALPVLILFAFAWAPALARAGWSAPFNLAAPGTLDYFPSQLAISSSGAGAAAYTVQDVDTPGSAQAYLVLRSAAGAVGAPFALAGTQQVLGLTYGGPGLELLTGTSPAGLDCCSSSALVDVSTAGTAGAPQPFVAGLTGATSGALAPLSGGRTVAAVATERGVWAGMTGSGGRLGRVRRLTGAGQGPQAMSVAALDGQASIIAWTAAGGPPGTASPRTVYYGLGSRFGPPRRAEALLQVPASDRIEELAAGRRRSGATVAWIEGSFDAGNRYRATVHAADVAAHPVVRVFPGGGTLAAGLSLAADAAGAQALVWKACRADGSCGLRVTTRSPHGRFRAPRSLGAIDASQTPALAVGPHGQVAVVWIRAGHPVAVIGSASSGALGPARVLSPSLYALDPTVAYGAHGALAAWTQGTLNTSVVAAAYG